MEQSEFEKTILGKRLRDYRNRSHLAESSESVLNRALRWFCELHGDIDPVDVGYGHVDDFRSWLKKGRAAASANREWVHAACGNIPQRMSGPLKNQ